VLHGLWGSVDCVWGSSLKSPAKKILHKSFARFSPVFVSLALALSVAPAALARARAEAGDTNTAVKRQSATTQFGRAEEQRAALNSKTTEKRTLAEYKQVVSSYRRVALITPRAPEVPDSLLAIAEVYTEMGDRFGRSYYQSAVDSYQFLVHAYPANHYCQDAILRVAKLQRDQLGDSALAKKAYEDFLKRYPRSPKKREVQEALAELALLQNSDTQTSTMTAAANSAPAADPAGSDARASASTPVHSGGKSVSASNSSEIPRVRRIRTAMNGDATRVTIDLENTVQYVSGRIANPDRIFFDLHAARLTPEVARGNIQVDGNLLTAVRVAQNHEGVVRVVLDVNGVADYTASLSNNPSQLAIDLYANSATVRTAKSKRGQLPAEDEASDNAGSPTGATGGSVQNVASKSSPVNPVPSGPPVSNSSSAVGGSIAASGSPVVANNSVPTAKNGKSRSIKAGTANTKPDLIQPATAPQPTRDGQSTLTRALGLKIGRIVIDAGHGGHDTGTIGPTGLMEKDLCLDVALRLGKIIQQRLPGAEVVYTRADDTFIPLEERTNIANQAKADLFISIHANSSQDHGARGIETYYLNLKGSAEAMEVAARENATAQEGVHDLQDLVKKIARTEKIDESREFAEDVQDSLSKRADKSGKSVKNRGVRKAPFLVLIGADMPSILTEISFLSNPADEQLLKKPEQRQKVAEGLYQGVASYLQSMNSVSVNIPAKAAGSRAAAAIEQSRNQN
jgi:N-acetylmuramoyl-L-alanine amidase